MKKGILIIAIVWILCNLGSYLLFGIGGALASTYICSAIVWFARKPLCRVLNI